MTTRRGRRIAAVAAVLLLLGVLVVVAVRFVGTADDRDDVGVAGDAEIAKGLRPDDRGRDVLQAQADATPSGGTLVVDRAWIRSHPLEIRRTMTVRFGPGGTIRMAADVDAVRVRASGVSVVDPVITGAGADIGGVAHGISAVGSPRVPVHDVAVVGGRIEHVPHDAVHLEYVDDVRVDGTRITTVGYAGVAGTGVVGGSIRRTVVTDVRQPSERVNSYGITLTRDATRPVSVTRRSAHVVIADNQIDGVPAWEGIDVHAAEDVDIRGNTVQGARVGIAAVPSKDWRDRSTTSVAPVDVTIRDNTVRRTSALAAGSGILVSGSGTTVGSTNERATGTVSGNRVTGAGGASEAGILLKLTRGFVVSGNSVISSSGRGITLPHSNDGVRLDGNVIAGVSGARVGIDTAGGANTGVVSRTRFGSQDPPLEVAVRTARVDGIAVSGSSWGNARVRIGT